MALGCSTPITRLKARDRRAFGRGAVHRAPRLHPRIAADRLGGLGTIGDDQARWIPLLEAHDRYGRSRGPLAAMLVHYKGPFRGSCWAYLRGATTSICWPRPAAPVRRTLAGIARFLKQRCFLHSLATEHDSARG